MIHTRMPVEMRVFWAAISTMMRCKGTKMEAMQMERMKKKKMRRRYTRRSKARPLMMR